MNDIQQPTEPIPAAFGTSGERVKHFRGILEDDPIAIAAFGIPIAVATVIGVNWLLPASVANFFHPFWRVVLPLIPAFHLTAAIQRRRKAKAMREKDYLQFTNYQSAVQTYHNAMRTYRNLQRETRYRGWRLRADGICRHVGALRDRRSTPRHDLHAVGPYSGPVARRGPDNGRIHRDNRRHDVCATPGFLPLPSLRIALGCQPALIPHWPCGGTESCGRRESGAP